MKKVDIDKKILEELYRFKNKGPTEIGKLFGVTRQTIWKRIKELDIKRCYDDKQWLIKMHHEKLFTIRDIAKIAHCKEHTISQRMKKFGIENITFNRPRNRFIYNFFEKIDTPEKAYWLGFLLADGNIYQTTLSIKIQKADEQHLHKLLKTLKATNNIENDFTIIRNNKHHSVRVRFCSKKMTNDLIKKGITPRKSTREKLPDFPTKFTKDFLRGFYDGDGSFHFWLSEERIECSVGFVGSFEMMSYCKKIMEIIVEDEVNIRPDRKIFKVFVGGEKAIKFLTWLYEGKTLYLERKYNKFKTFLNLCRRYSPISDRKAESEAEMTSPAK